MNLGDVVRLGPTTGHDGERGIIADFTDINADGRITYRYSIRLPDDSLLEVGGQDFQRTGESVLLFQPNEVVRVVRSDDFPELIGAEGIVCAFGEIAPREFEYAVYISHLERVYSLLGPDIESLGRFESV